MEKDIPIVNFPKLLFQHLILETNAIVVSIWCHYLSSLLCIFRDCIECVCFYLKARVIFSLNLRFCSATKRIGRLE